MHGNRTLSLITLSLAAMLGCGGDLALPSASEEPDVLRAVSPLSQPGRIGRSVPEAPTVLVLDGSGNPVVGADVAWDVISGGGTVSSPTTSADAEGRATVSWTLGIGVGVQKLAARVAGAAGSPVMFTATVLF